MDSSTCSKISAEPNQMKREKPTAASRIGPNEILLLVAAFILLAAVALRPSIRGNDGVGHYVYLASLLRGGDLDLGDDYRAFDRLKHYPYHFGDLPRSPQTGLCGNRFGVGAALLWAPFVFGLRLLPWGQPADTTMTGLTRAYEWAVAVGTASWVFLALMLLYRRLRRRHGPFTCGLVVAALLLATPLGFYALAHGSMSHGAEFFAATLSLLAFEAAWRRPSAGRAALLGAAAGLLTMIRIQDGAWALIFMAAVCLRAWYCEPPTAEDGGGISENTRLKRAVRHGLAYAGAGLVVFAPQLAVWQILYGSWLSGPAPYLDGSVAHFSLWPRYALAALFSERGGVLAWHPVMAVGLIGLGMQLAGWKSHRPICVVGLAGFAAQLLIVGSWSAWWAGASFGNRYFISTLPFLAVGLAWWLASGTAGAQRRRALLVVLLIFWNMGLLVQYATEMIPREDAVSWSRVLRQNLTDVPRYLWQRIVPG